ncbi:hypothetical protein KQ302_08660 [Synechococcus sp. CS-602]|uniref:hypothetical protein n=1 Tax=Synechococcus sp. CS-603 TaxID=2847981 RepID=UPI00223C3B52|nr:hypothetical protein [Synechococcus sp. CS-603]MCT0202216.1 hypothetical protein [Synechococcus sp. CS-603]MCT0205164.1 hypothetical protein [Synechococcus sp. CS-602]MCT4363399.1 hypothetical protein [Candidatus Regnicoccus frigidus MAG-AL1]
MALDSRATALTEATDQLERLSQRLLEGNGALYRDLALYLQVLREGLPMAVQQATFHVATQLVPERYSALAEGRRQELQQRLAELVKRCGCLLTLEQLVVLGQQVRRERRRQQRREQQRLMASMLDGGDSETASSPAAQAPLPPGSVRLGLDLPLSAELFASGLPGLAGLTDLATLVGPIGASEASRSRADVAVDDSDDEGLGDEDNDDSGDDDEDGSDDDDSEDDDSDVVEVLTAELLGETEAELEGQAERKADDQEGTPGNGETTEAIEPSLVPRQPLELLKWWDSLDRALERRLRNLSHAINLDLLRLGLTRSLLPINLLDAVLAGQVEAMPAPANLLRLSLPFGPDGMAGQLEAIGLLLRSADLEFDQARLRTCRRRLERRRQDVSKMARQYRHWQRRARSLEAEQQWLEDSQTNLPTPP